ncbi:hypothetical protein HKX48_004518 [Thoreauomyces humboldtii]|nr:hypothetical protein HKX48_004518 [Thoreauomyces humboldtii]
MAEESIPVVIDGDRESNAVNVVRTNTTGGVVWRGRSSGGEVGGPATIREIDGSDPTLFPGNEIQNRSRARDTAFGEPLSVPVYPREGDEDDGEAIEMSSAPYDRPADNVQSQDGYNAKRAEAGVSEIEVGNAARLQRTTSGATHRSKGTIRSSRRFKGIDPTKDDFDLATFLDTRKQKNGEAGFEVPQVFLSFKDLGVFGDAVTEPHIETVGAKILNFINIFPPLISGVRALTGTKLPTPIGRQILFPSSGFIKPGEMTLVLGRPGAGCSTLLRTLSNMTEGLSQVNGEVFYNGIDRKTFKEKYSHAIAYSPEDDPHYATLTVRQTLRFALECRVGGAVEGTRRERIENTIEVLLRVFGLQNCADTKVGDAMVRGCSGGEKKRVSIAEQLCIQASLGFWDGSSKGLDSSSALDFVRALRTATDIMQSGNVLSLYQASQDIYDLFDRVILVSDGHVIFFGPAQEAKPYFESIGFFCPKRKVMPDFLTGVTEPNERDIDRAWKGPVPNTAEEFEKLYMASDIYKDMARERESLHETMKSDHRGSVFDKQVKTNKEVLGRQDLLKTQYTTSFRQQWMACVKREIALQKGNVALIGRLFFDTVMAIIVGSAFFHLQLNVSGSFSRGGALFFAILYNCFGALASVPLVIQGRSVAAKHKSYMLYRTYIGPVVMQFTDIPISLMMIIVWSCINYWMVGLKAEVGAFFSYMAFLFAANQGFGGLVRVISSLAPNLEAATQINGIFLLFFIIHTGYIVPYKDMHPWLLWVFWIDPLAYGLRSLLENEFDGVRIDCSTGFLPHAVDPTGTYSNPAYSSCAAIKGGVPGESTVYGMSYLNATYGIATYNRWWNFLILMSIWFVVMIAMMVAAKLVDYAPRRYSVNVWKKARHLAGRPRGHSQHMNMAVGGPAGDAERGAGGVAVVPGSVDARSDAEEAAALRDVAKNIRAEDFTWKHINYTVPTKDGPKQLLNDVSGFVRAGQLTALMGSSGAGKTTLIDSITQRKTMGDLKGHIYIGKNPQGSDFKRMTAYCEQMDVHNPNQTVREAMQFSAMLRQPSDVSKAEKYAYVEEIIKVLELDPIAEAMIGEGGGGIGISNEQRKRLTIGVELVSKPKILYLDEPSSGLDSSAAFNIIRLLRTLADSGQAILCTIHQPSAVLFQQFDSLLLLARGGKTVYFGQLGSDCATIRGYFERQGAYSCPPTANVAEYILDAIGAGTARRDNTKNWPDMWRSSPEYESMYKEIDLIRTMGDSGAVDVSESSKAGTRKSRKTQFSVPFMTQLRVVWSRMILSYWRNPSYNFGRIISQVLASLLIGFTFYQLGNTSGDLQNKVFAIFMSMIIGALLINLVQPNYINNRSWFTRENSAGFYDWKAFAISVTTAELPFAAAAATCFFLIFYFIAHMNQDSNRAFYFWITYVLYNFFAISLGQMIAAVSPTIQFAAVLNPFFLSMQMLFCGVTITYLAMPTFWRSWLYWANPFHYFIEGVIGNELGGVPVQCESGSSSTLINIPSGQTCAQYFTEYFARNAPGQLVDGSATGSCGFCPFAVGDDFVDTLGWTFAHRWRNFGFLAMFWIFNLFMVALLVRVYKTGR